MKKLLLCAALATGALFGAETSNEGAKHNDDEFFQMPQDNSERLGEQLLRESRIFLGHYEPKDKRIHHTYEPQIIRHEKAGLLEQAAETGVHVSVQTLCGLLIHDIYSAGKGYFFPSPEEAFQESVAHLKLRQAENSETERELHLKMSQEIIENMAILRTLTAIEAERELTPAEVARLKLARGSLMMLERFASSAA